MTDYEENFIKLVKDWIDPYKQTNPNKFMIDRQELLEGILNRYDGKSIPLEHFTDEVVNRYTKGNPRNFEAFPVVYAYLCGILIRNKNLLTLKEGIELKKEHIERDRFIPPEVSDLY